jgi:exodeoxyribonuclease VII large subunit
LTVSKIEKIGMGKLFQDYLKLDEKFKKRGYYDEKNKKRIPTNIKNVGIITGNGASALEDIKDFLITNNFTGKVFIKYAAVQGINCSNDVSQAIKFFDNFKYENDHMDVIILARGGGSTEDLMGFSDKMVIETIFKSKICIISAIGHADDFMLSDKVADIRAITPTNAAEILVTYTSSKIKNFNDTKKFLSNTSLLIIRDKINTYKNLLLNIGNKLSILSDYEKTFRDDKQKALDKIQLNILNKIHNLKTKINKLRNIVNFMNVDKILDEGYAIILKDKTVCADINTLKKKDLIEIKTKDGIIKAIIK